MRSVRWGALELMSQVSPHEAVSNVSLWWAHIGPVPHWLRSPHIDQWGKVLVFGLLVITMWPSLRSWLLQGCSLFSLNTLIPLKQAASKVYELLRIYRPLEARLVEEVLKVEANGHLIMGGIYILKTVPVWGRRVPSVTVEPIRFEVSRHADGHAIAPDGTFSFQSTLMNHQGRFTDIAVKKKELAHVLTGIKSASHNSTV